MRYHRVRVSSLARTLGRALLTYWSVLTLVFVLVRLAPGDPAAVLLPPGATPRELTALRSELGLDAPLAVQYARWARALLAGELGVSFASHRPVTESIAAALPVSLALGGASLLLSFALGTVTGLWQASRQGRTSDTLITVASVVLVASPAYWLGLGAIAVFTYLASAWSLPLWMRLPAVGVTTPGVELHGPAHVVDVLRHSVLPVSILAAIGAGGVARYVRSGALDRLREDWVRTARAKGLGERDVLRRHLLANLRAPLVTLFALTLPGVVAGSVFIETIFGWPGMGRLLVLSVIGRDHPVVLASAMIFAAVVIVANLAAELLLPLVDPRVDA